MPQAIVAWLTRLIDELPPKLGWLLMVMILAGAWVAHSTQVARIDMLAENDARQTEQFREVVKSVDELTVEMKLYRQAREDEIKELRDEAKHRQRIK